MIFFDEDGDVVDHDDKHDDDDDGSAYYDESMFNNEKDPFVRTITLYGCTISRRVTSAFEIRVGLP